MPATEFSAPRPPVPCAIRRGFAVEFPSDATGTLPLSSSAGRVTAEELHRSILCAQQVLLSEVLPSPTWISRL